MASIVALLMYFAVAQEHMSNIIEEQEAIVSKQEELITDLSEEIYIIKEEASSNTKALKKDKEEITDKLDKVKKELKKKDKKIEKYNMSKVEDTVTPTSSNDKPNSVEDKGIFNISAYGSDCDGCSGITADGTNVSNTTTHNGYTVLAADTSVLPFGTKVEIEVPNGPNILGVVKDRGGAIVGKKLDVLMESEEATYEFGRFDAKVKVIE